MNSGERICIVTGAGRGIGRATAARLTAGGARVVAVARSKSELRATADACAPGSCIVHPCDATDAAQVAALIDRCSREFGRIDALINNAGTAPLSPVESMGDAEFESALAVNVRAVFLLCRAAWPLLKTAGGTIVNISSLAADDPFPGFAVYGGTKAFVNTFSLALAGEGKPHGIRVFVVAPGAVETGMLREHFPGFPAEQTLGADDVAATIEWLLDDRCTHATGAVIRVKR